MVLCSLCVLVSAFLCIYMSAACVYMCVFFLLCVCGVLCVLVLHFSSSFNMCGVSVSGLVVYNVCVLNVCSVYVVYVCTVCGVWWCLCYSCCVDWCYFFRFFLCS